MKYLVKFFVITFFVLSCTYTQAEQKIVYVDMKSVLNTSKAGKGAQDYLKKVLEKDTKDFANSEKELKKDEAELLEKKTILSKEEYQKKADELRKKVINFQTKKRNAFDEITKKRAEAREKLIKGIDPILKKHIKENNISLVMDKKNIIAASGVDFDITEIIIEKLNKELPSLNLK